MHPYSNFQRLYWTNTQTPPSPSFLMLQRLRIMCHTMPMLILKQNLYRYLSPLVTLPSAPSPLSSYIPDHSYRNACQLETYLRRILHILFLRVFFIRNNLLYCALTFAAPDLSPDLVAFVNGLLVLVLYGRGHIGNFAEWFEGLEILWQKGVEGREENRSRETRWLVEERGV